MVNSEEDKLTKAPVITIDGPSGSGKGTISHLLAQKLNWSYLDSGALYRALGIAVQQQNIATTDEHRLAHLASELEVDFIHQVDGSYAVVLAGQDVTQTIRDEACGKIASQVSALASVRQALLSKQRSYRLWPGLVTDGRDMGTIVFPDAELKVFLTASPQERALRRYNQLKDKGNNVSLDGILSELIARDKRDTERSIAPLVPAKDAIVLDTSTMSIDQVLQAVLKHAKDRFNGV